MKKIKITLGIGILSLGFLACNNVSHHKQEVTSLAKAFEGKFLIGAALNSAQILGEDTAALKLVASQFNSIVAENSMKSEVLQPQAGVFDFTESDKLVELGQKNKAFVVGHNLVWHSQAPAWFFVDKEGNDVSRDTLIERMKNHIHEVVGRYRGKIKGWDVVNEALNEDGSLRKSKFYHIIGPEYIELAFQFAHEADQDAELYYNDYNMYKPEKRKGAVHLIENLKAKGLRVDAIGMQAHYGLNKDLTKEIEESIMAFANTGVKVMITELDVSVLPFPAEEITAR